MLEKNYDSIDGSLTQKFADDCFRIGSGKVRQRNAVCRYVDRYGAITLSQISPVYLGKYVVTKSMTLETLSEFSLGSSVAISY